ncbi:MAG: hypothetical protein F6K47_09810 [Symploca sp. SIO2E6]|nr:hypothetical protein [Symploca sp. SIO2E6]
MTLIREQGIGNWELGIGNWELGIGSVSSIHQGLCASSGEAFRKQGSREEDVAIISKSGFVPGSLNSHSSVDGSAVTSIV